MGNIIPFCAFPRSGATLLATLLNNNPHIIVTPEMNDILDPVKPYRWSDFIDFFNYKFESNLGKYDDISIINDYLRDSNKYVFYRIWLLGNLEPSLNRINSYFPSSKKLFLLRNFFSILCSSKGARPHTRKNALDTLESFKDFVGYVDSSKDGFTMHYEDFTLEPAYSLGRLFRYIGFASNEKDIKNMVGFNFKGMDTKMQRIISGDHKIRKTTKIQKFTDYKRFEVGARLYMHTKKELKGFKCIKYISLERGTFFNYLQYKINESLKKLKLMRKSLKDILSQII